jgi:mono/diheme cytochrome c family protein
LVASDPLELQRALEEGPAYKPHDSLEIPTWMDELTRQERTTLINFLIAPDGKRLFTVNCSPCHGSAIAFDGEEEELREIISSGGLHLSMPAWQDRLDSQEIEVLGNYVLEPSSSPQGEGLFADNCSSCHGSRIPAAVDFEQAIEVITSGGAHQTMPIWGQILTDAQLNALVSYTLESSQGTPVVVGQDLFTIHCASCHGDFGEGGPNPARPDDVIAPISTAEYLRTRDNFTLASIIAQGQPNFGMSPFGSNFGGPLDDEQIDAIVAFMRSWENDPPVDLPPQVAVSPTVSLSAEEIFIDLCAQCHGENGIGVTGPSLRDPDFLSMNSQQEIFDTISNGHEATAMISWGELLSDEQIQGLTEFILQFEPIESESVVLPTPREVSFITDVMPIFEAKCIPCHGNMGGWNGTTYLDVMNTGNNAPTIIPGNPNDSLLAQKILGNQEEGAIMPPGGKMTNSEIQTIIDWIDQGALDN